VDADTARSRALWDAKGRVVRCGVTFRAGAVVSWVVRRSLEGRTDQWDLVADGRLVNRMGLTRMARVLPGVVPGVAWTGGEA
jgi:hypothetical protein